ncbi:Ribosome biogenesis protein 1 [Rhizophlyctis rosea]|nr:Ribosome biogenesis protein 1 [Rhizophlyctis rosea]
MSMHGPQPPFGVPPGVNPYIMQQAMAFQSQHPRPMPPPPGPQNYWQQPGQQPGMHGMQPQSMPPPVTSAVPPHLQQSAAPISLTTSPVLDSGADLARNLEGLQVSGQQKTATSGPKHGAGDEQVEGWKEDAAYDGAVNGRSVGKGVHPGKIAAPIELAVQSEPPSAMRPDATGGDGLERTDVKIEDSLSGPGTGDSNARLPGVGAHLLQSNRRGTGRGGRRGFSHGPRGNRIVIPDQDFDFESANAKFNKTELVHEVVKDDKSPVQEGTLQEGTPVPAAPVSDGEEAESPTAFYNKSSFFDDISCESKDRAEGDRVNRRARQYEERRLNLETFGQTGMDANRSGYRRGGANKGTRDHAVVEVVMVRVTKAIDVVAMGVRVEDTKMGIWPNNRIEKSLIPGKREVEKDVGIDASGKTTYNNSATDMKRIRESPKTKGAAIVGSPRGADEDYKFEILHDDSESEPEENDGSLPPDVEEGSDNEQDGILDVEDSENGGASDSSPDGQSDGNIDTDNEEEAEEEGVDDEDDEEENSDVLDEDFVDSDEDFAGSSDDGADFENEAGFQNGKGVHVLRPKPRPEIEADYASDSSDEEAENTIGNVPKEWYNDFDHMGYDIKGNKVMKGVQGDQLDKFLSTMDDPNAWRTVYDPIEGKNITLSERDLEMLKRIQDHTFPEAEYDPYQPTVEWFTSKTEITPLNAAPEPKRRFIPSKLEGQRIMHIARGIQSGRIVPGRRQERVKPKYYAIWDEADEPSKEHPMHIQAPKMALPEHLESYNPPAEYLFTPEELENWQNTDAEDRPTNFVPKKYSNFRSIPGYDRFIQERFDRCLDLYLCPRIQKKKINIDPESLIPKLPSPKDLRPFPTALAVTYKGHTGRVRSISLDPTGQWLVSGTVLKGTEILIFVDLTILIGSDDGTVRIWEVISGRCLNSWKLEETIQSVAWNPNRAVPLIAVAAQTRVLLIDPKMGSVEPDGALDALFGQIWGLEQQKQACEWSKPSVAEAKSGFRAQLTFMKAVTYVTWHRKGDYFATVSPDAASTAVLIHQLSKGQTQNPFRKSKGLVQRVLFHPSKPFLFVATQRYVRVYNLLKQDLAKKLQTGAKWISSIDVHPGGDNVIVGTYDKRVSWFDMDLSTKPYKTLRYHKFAVRHVTFHRRYPLFASCSDDGSVNIFHGMVYNDLMQNPLIVPVKTLRAHDVTDSLGALHCEFHPTQPWIFSCGSDKTIKLFS